MVGYMIFPETLAVFFQSQIKDTAAVNNVAELIMKGGFIMIPIILLSIISLYFFIERVTYIRRNSAIDKTMITTLIADLNSKKPGASVTENIDPETSLGRILQSGLSQSGKSAREIEGFMEGTANLEISEMEKNTGYLGIIAGIAPMLGFIGTISGVIKIFYNISLADNISIGIIAGGLYQKMICSGAGLIVGVIAYSCYHYIQMMIDRFSIDMQRQVNEVVKVL
jgi:biopolymer transport protein ExbB